MQFHIFQDQGLKWRWQLSNADGKVVADSGESYRDKDDCLGSIVQVQACDQALVLENVVSLMHTEMLQMPGLFHKH